MTRKRKVQLAAIGFLASVPVVGSLLAANAILNLDSMLSWQRNMVVGIMGWYLVVGVLVTFVGLVMFWLWLFDIPEKVMAEHNTGEGDG